MSDYEFIGDICESTLIGYRSQLKNFDAKQIADLIFLYFIALQIMKSEFTSAPFANDYASTTNSGSFDDFRQSGTDLYLLIHTLFGKNNETSFKLLNNQEPSNLFKQKLSFSISDAKRWLSSTRSINSDSDQRFLLKLENGLHISDSNYKSMRRLAGEWEGLDKDSRELCMTRLLFAFKNRAPRSELLSMLDKVARSQNLIIKGAKDPEKSTPTSSGIGKAFGIGAAITLGVTANAIARTLKNIGAHSSRK